MAAAEEKLQASVTAAQQEIAAQLAAASGVEAKLMGLLGFVAAIGGVVLTVAKGLASSRWILLIGASGTVVIILDGLLAVRELKSGPDAVAFHARYRDKSAEAFLEQLLADLGETISVNLRSIEDRNALFTSAIAWSVLFAIWFGLVRLLG